MRRISTVLLSIVALFLLTPISQAEDYLAKDGKLTQKLKVVQLQGGFAGFTGVQWIVNQDGSWTEANIFNKRITPKNKGKLSPKQLATLAEVLSKYQLTKLPAKSGKQPGANPHILKFEYGKKTVSLVGQVAPKIDGTASVGRRFAGIWLGVRNLLKTTKKAE